jgi:hypothetical protein
MSNLFYIDPPNHNPRQPPPRRRARPFDARIVAAAQNPGVPRFAAPPATSGYTGKNPESRSDLMHFRIFIGRRASGMHHFSALPVRKFPQYIHQKERDAP